MIICFNFYPQASFSDPSPNLYADELIKNILHIQNFLDSINDKANLQCVVYGHEDKAVPKENPCLIIYELSAKMNRHTRNISVETLMSLLALGAGRSGDFIKYLAEKKDPLIAANVTEAKALKREIKSSKELIKKMRKSINKTMEQIDFESVDSEVIKYLDDLQEELKDLKTSKDSLALTLNKIESEISKEGLLKKKISVPFWPLKLLQMALSVGILSHEVYLCDVKSVSCLTDQIVDLISPIPITDVGDATLASRYETIPALLILDVERKIIKPEEACRIVKESKPLLRDFGIVKILNEEMKKY